MSSSDSDDGLTAESHPSASLSDSEVEVEDVQEVEEELPPPTPAPKELKSIKRRSELFISFPSIEFAWRCENGFNA